MMVQRMMLPAAVLLAACTTQFNRPGPTDGTVDTTEENVSDGTDTMPPDVEPDVPPPTWHVECALDRETYVYLHDTWFDTACTDGSCNDANIYMGFNGPTLIAIAGGESREGLSGGWFFGAAVNLPEGGFEHGDAMPLPFSGSDDGWYSNVRNGSLIQHFNGVDLLFARFFTDSGGTLTDQELWALRTTASGLNVNHYYQVVMNEVPNDERGRISHPRGLVSEGNVFFFVMMEEDIGGGPSPTQLYGASVPVAQYNMGNTWAYGDEFVPMQPDRSQITFPHLPETVGGLVVLPHMELIVVGFEGEYHSRLWTVDRSIPPGDLFEPGIVDFETDHRYDGSVAGTGIGPGRYAMAALSSDAPFTMAGLSPPYDLHVAVADPGSGAESIRGSNALRINDTTMRDTDRIDFLDYKVLFNEALGVFHYVTVIYPGDGNAVVAIYSFDTEGHPVMDPLEPWTFETGTLLMPGFDVVIQPATGTILLAHFVGDDVSDTADGFTLAGVTCTRIEDL